MTLQEMVLETMLSRIGRAEPSISGSTAALVAAQLGAAMARMALSVSGKHGADCDPAIERLDGVVTRIREAAERDRTAAQALLNTFRRGTRTDVRSNARNDATREPLLAAGLLVDLLEGLNDAGPDVRRSVASDFFGGIELIAAAFAAVTMAAESNIRQDESGELADRTAQTRSNLHLRHDAVMAAIRSKQECQVYNSR